MIVDKSNLKILVCNGECIRNSMQRYALFCDRNAAYIPFGQFLEQAKTRSYIQNRHRICSYSGSASTARVPAQSQGFWRPKASP